MNKYKIYFCGETVSGLDTQQGQENIKKVFKSYTDSDRLANKKILVKKDLSKDKAITLALKLKKLDLKVQIVKYSPKPNSNNNTNTSGIGSSQDTSTPSPQERSTELPLDIKQSIQQKVNSIQAKDTLTNIINTAKQNVSSAQSILKEKSPLAILDKRSILVGGSLLFFIGAGYALVGGKNSHDLPSCDDPAVKATAMTAIQDAYTKIGRPGFEKIAGYSEILDNLKDIPKNSQTDSMMRVAANALKIPVENTKACRAQIGDQDSYVAVQIAKSSEGDLGYIVSNIGWPGLIGSSGWVSQLP